MSKFTRLLGLPTINMKTILYNNQVAGTVSKFEIDGRAEITYAINKSLWGKGITTAALQAFLPLEPMRPIFGRTAFDNYGSVRVLEKCGFQKTGTDKGFANARGKEIEEFIFRLV